MHPEHHLRDEFYNAVTHGLGAFLSAIGGVVLITLAALYSDSWQLVSAVIFSVSLIGLYGASTLYHSTHEPKAKHRYKVLDHCMIYVLIAGSYTPFTLIGLRGPWGWGLFAAIWTIALAGVVFKLFHTGRFPRLSTALYVAMGWLVVVAIKPMLASIDAWTLGWLLAGGVFYTLGTYFYHRESIPYAHAIWHLFVIAGSVCHFVAVAAQVV